MSEQREEEEKAGFCLQLCEKSTDLRVRTNIKRTILEFSHSY